MGIQRSSLRRLPTQHERCLNGHRDVFDDVHQRQRHAGRHQPVLDRGGTRLVCHQSLQNRHGAAPQAVPRGGTDLTATATARSRARPRSYLRPFCTDEKPVLRSEPTPLMTVMIATEIPAAIRPYSMAVAPDWSRRKRMNMDTLLTGSAGTSERSNVPNSRI